MGDCKPVIEESNAIQVVHRRPVLEQPQSEHDSDYEVTVDLRNSEHWASHVASQLYINVFVFIFSPAAGLNDLEQQQRTFTRSLFEHNASSPHSQEFINSLLLDFIVDQSGERQVIDGPVFIEGLNTGSISGDLLEREGR